ncbi:Chloride channel protein 2 [Balamuthia mandrillaris]
MKRARFKPKQVEEEEEEEESTSSSEEDEPAPERSIANQGTKLSSLPSLLSLPQPSRLAQPSANTRATNDRRDWADRFFDSGDEADSSSSSSSSDFLDSSSDDSDDEAKSFGPRQAAAHNTHNVFAHINTEAKGQLHIVDAARQNKHTQEGSSDASEKEEEDAATPQEDENQEQTSAFEPPARTQSPAQSQTQRPAQTQAPIRTKRPVPSQEPTDEAAQAQEQRPEDGEELVAEGESPQVKKYEERRRAFRRLSSAIHSSALKLTASSKKKKEKQAAMIVGEDEAAVETELNEPSYIKKMRRASILRKNKRDSSIAVPDQDRGASPWARELSEKEILEHVRQLSKGKRRTRERGTDVRRHTQRASSSAVVPPLSPKASRNNSHQRQKEMRSGDRSNKTKRAGRSDDVVEGASDDEYKETAMEMVGLGRNKPEPSFAAEISTSPSTASTEETFSSDEDAPSGRQLKPHAPSTKAKNKNHDNDDDDSDDSDGSTSSLHSDLDSSGWSSDSENEHKGKKRRGVNKNKDIPEEPIRKELQDDLNYADMLDELEELGGFQYEQTVFGSYRNRMAMAAQKIAKGRGVPPPQKDHLVDMDYLGKRFAKYLSGTCCGSIWKGIAQYVRKKQWTFVWAFVVLLGVLAATIASGMDYAIAELNDSRRYLTGYASNSWAEYVIWTTFTLFFAFVSAAITRIGPCAQGSGIPEMKSMLSGVPLSAYLSLRTLIVKIVGLTTSLGSGLLVGKEGPYVHTSSALANNLAKLPFFTNIRNNPALKQQMLAVGCAVGVASTFNTPIGGVLFSIEVTSTYYPIRNYFWAFNCAYIGSTVWRLFIPRAFFLETKYTTDSYSYTEIPFFCLLGILMGLLGAMFISLTSHVVAKRRLFVKVTETWPSYLRYVSHPYMYLACVAWITATVTFPDLFGQCISLAGRNALRDLFNEEPLQDNPELNAQDWMGRGIAGNLLIFFFTRYCIGLLSISLPIPNGVYVPVLVIGASMGRLLGEVMKRSFPEGLYMEELLVPDEGTINPGAYAIVGAAAFAAAVTHTLSSAVIVFELTGEIALSLPIGLAVMVAIAVCSSFEVSIYEKITIFRGLPFLPDIPHRTWNKTAGDFMRTDVPFLTKDSSPRSVAKLLTTDDTRLYPVVDSGDSRLLVGSVTRKELLTWLLSCAEAMNAPINLTTETSQGGIFGAFNKVFGGVSSLTKKDRKRHEHLKQKRQGRHRSSSQKQKEQTTPRRIGPTATSSNDRDSHSTDPHDEEQRMKSTASGVASSAALQQGDGNISTAKEQYSEAVDGGEGVGGANTADVGVDDYDSDELSAAAAAVLGQRTRDMMLAIDRNDDSEVNKTRLSFIESSYHSSDYSSDFSQSTMADKPAASTTKGTGHKRQQPPRRRHPRQKPPRPTKPIPPLPVKPAPVQLLVSTPLPHVHMLFITLRLSEAFVTEKGSFLGVVTRTDLKHTVGAHQFAISRMKRYLRRQVAHKWAGCKRQRREWRKRRRRAQAEPKILNHPRFYRDEEEPVGSSSRSFGRKHWRSSATSAPTTANTTTRRHHYDDDSSSSSSGSATALTGGGSDGGPSDASSSGDEKTYLG